MDDKFKSEENQTPKNENFDSELSSGPTEDELEAANLDTEPVDLGEQSSYDSKPSQSSGTSFSFQSGDKSKTNVIEKQTVIEKPINQNQEPIEANQKPKSGKKKLLVTLAIILLILGAVAAWFFLISDKAEAPHNNGNQVGEQVQQTKNEELKPYALAYVSQISEQDVTPDCSPPPEQKAYLSPIDGSPRIDSTDFGNVYIVDSSVDNKKIVVVSNPGCDASEGQAVWFSQNSGESYEKIYNASKPESVDTQGEQITSIQISSDGQSVVINSYSSQFNSTIKEINLSSKEVKDLFSIEQKAVFIKGYDIKKGSIYYFVGCYNCDANSYNKLYVRNINNDKEELVFEHDRIGYQTILNEDLSKILVSKETPGEFPGGGPPYDIEEFDLETKTFKNLKTITDNGVVTVGYTENQEPYYTFQNKIIKKVEDGTEITVYESPKPIFGVYLVDENQVIYSSGEYNNLEVIIYNSQEKTSKSLLTSDGSINIFGITWK